jgi:orotidine-5'-phosphate decarboxylase
MSLLTQSAEAAAGDRLTVDNRLIVALDSPDAASAMRLAGQLEGVCNWVKVGLELYLSAGQPVIDSLRECGFRIFLDLKLHDIPNTVAGAVRSAAASGADLLTVHTLGGPAMLAAAQKAAIAVPDAPQLLGVTVLTSMDATQLHSVGIAYTPSHEVERLARMGLAAGLRGFVCSPEEVGNLRQVLGPDVTLVTPGIRPAGADAGDQQRISTPADALRAGADYLVVGRPITQATDPQAAARAILAEMATVAK